MNAVVKSIESLETPSWKDKVRYLVKEMGAMPQVECPLKHYFAPGVYVREIFMPKDSIVIGKIHKTKHFNIIQKGCVTLIREDGTHETLKGPLTFTSEAGVQKVLYIHDDTVWSTVHVTENTDLESLESELIEPDDYPRFNRTLERLQIMAAKNETQKH